MQNKVIFILASVVIKDIISLCKTGKENFFCIKADEACDARSVENLTAVYMADILLQVLTDCEFNCE